MEHKYLRLVIPSKSLCCKKQMIFLLNIAKNHHHQLTQGLTNFPLLNQLSSDNLRTGVIKCGLVQLLNHPYLADTLEKRESYFCLFIPFSFLARLRKVWLKSLEKLLLHSSSLCYTAVIRGGFFRFFPPMTTEGNPFTC